LRLIFVCWPFEDQGSSLVIQGYTEAAKALGHEVAVYGCPYDKIPLNYSISIGSADAVVFLFEWTIRQYYGDAVDLVRLVGKIPRRRRVIIDGDGNYNDVISVDDDFNHADSESSRRWIELCDSLSDKIYQPTRRPVRSNVRSFLFYAYNPSWERPLDFKAKEFSMLYVGHSKGRWRPMERVLSSLEPVRERLGRVGLVGHGWDSPPEWATRMHIEGAYYTDKRRLERLGVELLPAVPFAQVIRTMGKALINPVLLRPTFGRMRLVTPRLFETPASGTIPLFALDETHVRDIYGSDALALRLPDVDPQETIARFVERPQEYADIVMGVRQHLADKHSYAARLKELIEIIKQ
jgi:glycosyltransferase involved in cell wall biosynthesis